MSTQPPMNLSSLSPSHQPADIVPLASSFHATVPPLRIAECAERVVCKIEDLLSVIDDGTILSQDSAEQGWAESSLLFLRNAFVIPHAMKASVQPVAEDMKIRGYYQREVAKSFLEMYEQGDKSGAAISAIAGFLREYSDALSLSARYQYEASERLLAPALSTFTDALYAIGADAHYNEFRDIMKNDIDHIRAQKVPNGKELWQVQCFDSCAMFYSKFPTLKNQRTVIDTIKEKSAEVAWKSALKDS